MHLGNPRSPSPLALETDAVDERTRRTRNALGQKGPLRFGILENAAGTRQGKGLRPLPESQRLFRGPSQGRRIGFMNPDLRPKKRLPGGLKTACVITKTKPLDGFDPNLPLPIEEAGANHGLRHEPPLEVSIPINSSSERPRCARPCLKTADTVADTPAHETIDGDACLGANDVRALPRDLPAVKTEHGSPYALVAHEDVGASAQKRNRRARRTETAALGNRRLVPADLDKQVRRTADSKRRQIGKGDVQARRDWLSHVAESLSEARAILVSCLVKARSTAETTGGVDTREKSVRVVEFARVGVHAGGEFHPEGRGGPKFPRDPGFEVAAGGA